MDIVYIFPLTNLFAAAFYMCRYAGAVINVKKSNLYIAELFGVGIN